MINRIIERVLNYRHDEVPKDFVDKLDPVNGMSGHAAMYLLNQLVRCLDEDKIYLEVGTYKGKTLLSAAYGNKQKCIGVDNFSQTFHSAGDNMKNELLLNLQNFKNNTNIEFIEDDYVNLFCSEKICKKKVGIYFYDGNHAEEHQYAGVKMAIPYLSDEALILVDDSADGSRQAVFNAYDRLVSEGFPLEIVRHFEEPLGPSGYWAGILAIKYVRQ